MITIVSCPLRRHAGAFSPLIDGFRDAAGWGFFLLLFCQLMNILSSLFCHLSCFACSVLLPPPIRMMREIMRKTASNLSQTTSRKKKKLGGTEEGVVVNQHPLWLLTQHPTNAPTPLEPLAPLPVFNAIC